MLRKLAAALALVAMPHVAQAQELTNVAQNETGDTAWILTATALVLLMTLPGLGLFYGGLVRAKNFLSVLVQVAAVAGIASVLWIVVGYTLAFGNTTRRLDLGDGSKWMLINLDNLREGITLPESTFVAVPDDLRSHHTCADGGRMG